MNIASVGIDLGKTTFHLVALGERNKVLIRKKFSRAQLLAHTANLCCPAARTIAISLCCSRQQLDGRGKDATLGKHRTLSTFPPPRRRRRLKKVRPRSAEERRRRNNSPTACRKTCWR